MFYFLYPLKDDISILFNLFRYITFRAAGASVTAFLLCLWLGPPVIRYLKKLRVTACQEREHARPIHDFYKDKQDVPTMGGVLIVLSVVFSMLLWGNLTSRAVWILIATALWFGLLGFIDDRMKLLSRSSRGLTSRWKLLGQIAAGIVLGVLLYSDPGYDKWLYIPLFKKGVFYLGILMIPFVILVLTGASNALNLTDGLDGLAVGCALFTASAFAIMAYVVGRADFSSYLGVPFIPAGGEISVFCACLVGALAGFLWYNSFPAEVMMGDTGSLALGGMLGAVSILIKKEVVLMIAGGIFVWEALSVILQVISFRCFGKRIFLMSPFHHHLQLKGWPESKVTVRLWILAFILAILSLSTLKVR